ncbi:helix-hairpin-helix domain-containing protein [Nonomuraea thailandensis]
MDFRNADLLLADARALLSEHASVRAQAQHALDALRRDVARAGLEAVPVSRLKDVTDGRLRVGTLEKAGFATVRQVLEATPYELQLLPGIGARTAGQIHAAARQIEQAAAEAASLRLDVDRPDHHTTELVVALHRLVGAGPDLPRALDAAGDLAGRLAPLLAQARPARSRLRMMFTLPARRRRARRRSRPSRACWPAPPRRGCCWPRSRRTCCARRPATSRRGRTSSRARRSTSPCWRSWPGSRSAPGRGCCRTTWRPRSPRSRWTTATGGCPCAATRRSGPASRSSRSA